MSKELLAGEPEEKDKKGRLEGEGLVIPLESLQHNDRTKLMNALHAFQYGTGEESDEGFKQLGEIASSSQEQSDE